MTAVFVHGVPETPAVWHGLLAALGRPDTVTLSLPGFDAARPAGFGATMDEYAAWLAAQLERLGDPVDLVGHDWGGGFVVRVVSTRPELVRSWVTDAAGVGDAGFEWHDFAKIWQTPQAGEDFWDQQLAAPAQERAGVFQMFGVPEQPARDLASHINPTMAECILSLYRSAVDVAKQWGPDFAAIPAPGLVIIPGQDPFLSAASAAKAAARAGAKTVALDGLGHWWMLQDPARAATSTSLVPTPCRRSGPATTVSSRNACPPPSQATLTNPARSAPRRAHTQPRLCRCTWAVQSWSPGAWPKPSACKASISALAKPPRHW